ncbi:HAD family phosphatase [soil metagenome]
MSSADSPGRTSTGAVVFDLGNVLIRWDPHPAVARGVGDDEATRFLAAEDFDFLAWNHRLDAGCRWVDAAADVDASHAHWSPHVAAYGEHFPLSITEPIEANVSVLRDLHAAGVPLFALTNWSDELFPHALARHDFLGLFEDIVVSGAEGLAKPDPAIFERLRDRVGRPLAECVFVDDSAANVAAAATAGLDAIRFTDNVPLRPQLRARGLPV